MALILSIDTSLEVAAICLADDGHIIGIKKNSRQTDHAAWIQIAIKELFEERGRKPGDLSAIAITAGPGSYTGLRVGMATAKGMCYALGVPLITESTLRLLAQRVKKEIATNGVHEFPVLICPMIDARRMEVFTSLFDLDLNEVMEPAAIVLDKDSFAAEMAKNVVIFCGNGSKKWQNLCFDSKAVFADVFLNVADLAEIAAEKLKKREFSDLAYAEPAYLKNVYTGTPRY
ncbi:MAG: tRNA (adenosine(37)-N6)-threonylcarbamoyltransferase complex dimerization subunit type 1 TsaB [Chitinophagaceae bacterium]|nr:tRNA (adenosine(37)-N6)-threonylcarbamoyltransferase complex dimerization subunit type 1 TsaB [Chitinophagaceae bacterium]